MSYGRHPEVAASYSAVLNGVRFAVHHASQASTEPPLVDIPVSGYESLAERVNSLLSPAAIRRDCKPPVVDLEKPLADGLRSRAEIRGGEICYEECSWFANFEFADEQRWFFDEICRRQEELRVAITGGTICRDAASRICARLSVSLPHTAMTQYA
jgi:hypothetical protein